MDSLLKTLIPSANSDASWKNTGTRLTKALVVAEMARLTAVFGNAKDRPEAMLELMADEWHTVLKAYPFEMVHDAVTDLIGERKYWPVVADVKAGCEAKIMQLEFAKAQQEIERGEVRRPAPPPKETAEYDAFVSAVLRFVKRDAETFVDFRDAGVRALFGIEDILGFDTAEQAEALQAKYGAQINAETGRDIQFQEAPPATSWVKPKWDYSKVFTKH